MLQETQVPRAGPYWTENPACNRMNLASSHSSCFLLAPSIHHALACLRSGIVPLHRSSKFPTRICQVSPMCFVVVFHIVILSLFESPESQRHRQFLLDHTPDFSSQGTRRRLDREQYDTLYPHLVCFGFGTLGVLFGVLFVDEHCNFQTLSEGHNNTLDERSGIKVLRA